MDEPLDVSNLDCSDPDLVLEIAYCRFSGKEYYNKIALEEPDGEGSEDGEEEEFESDVEMDGAGGQSTKRKRKGLSDSESGSDNESDSSSSDSESSNDFGPIKEKKSKTKSKTAKSNPAVSSSTPSYPSSSSTAHASSSTTACSKSSSGAPGTTSSTTFGLDPTLLSLGSQALGGPSRYIEHITSFSQTGVKSLFTTADNHSFEKDADLNKELVEIMRKEKEERERRKKEEAEAAKAKAKEAKELKESSQADASDAGASGKARSSDRSISRDSVKSKSASVKSLPVKNILKAPSQGPASGLLSPVKEAPDGEEEEESPKNNLPKPAESGAAQPVQPQVTNRRGSMRGGATAAAARRSSFGVLPKPDVDMKDSDLPLDSKFITLRNANESDLAPDLDFSDINTDVLPDANEVLPDPLKVEVEPNDSSKSSSKSKTPPSKSKELSEEEDLDSEEKDAFDLSGPNVPYVKASSKDGLSQLDKLDQLEKSLNDSLNDYSS